MKPTDLFVWGFVAHIVADWIFQNQWMSDNKTSLRHPAAWVHSGIHFAAMLLVFPFWAALLIAATHILIDTRVPLQMWRRLYRQTTEGPIMLVFGMWQDQSAHIAVLGVVALLAAKF